jgi:uncharacterized protein YkwD
MSKRTTQTPLHHKVRRTAKRHVKMAVVPHKANQYKPHLIRRHGLIVILVAVLLAQLIGHLAYFRNILGTENHVSVVELLNSTNAERQKQGIEPLKLDTRLSDAAYMKAKDMLANQYWSHDSPSGVQPWKWLADADYNYSYAGENLARNFSTSQSVVSAWMASPSHRENVLKSQYQDVGFATVDGVMNGRPVSLVVAMYGTPATSGVGAVKGANFTAPTAANLNLVSRVGIGLQSISPAILASVVLMLLAVIVALASQLYHRHIPKYLQSTWNRHHGTLKALGLSSLVVVVVTLYSTNGQL